MSTPTSDEVRVFSQNVKFGALSDGRWEEQAGVIRDSGASVVLLQELDTITNPAHRQRIRDDLGMELTYSLAVTPEGHKPAKGHTAAAWDPMIWELLKVDVDYSAKLHHSYCGVHLRRRGHPVMRWSKLAGREVEAAWVFISVHLTPHSAEVAMQEAQLLISRVGRDGGLGGLAGDVNHFPELVRDIEGAPDELDPDFSQMRSYNRASRCLTRDKATDPWVANEVVGKKLRDGDLVDVARHFAIIRRDPSYLGLTGRHGLVRVDQAHVTRALVPALTSYVRCDTASDHYGIMFGFDPDEIDKSELFDYT
ncbi:hypothetical protein ACQEVF_57335 [Nonomuraea polychroma]|uniref:hypothetical protein n=1 Tax=Nonomuraea polychroma TaxID=46176 RepID=UPI003D94BCA0